MNNSGGDHHFPRSGTAQANDKWRNYHQYPQHPGPATYNNYNNNHQEHGGSSSSQSTAEWDRPGSSSQKCHSFEPEAEEDPDGVLNEPDNEDLELMMKHKELQVILKKALLLYLRQSMSSLSNTDNSPKSPQRLNQMKNSERELNMYSSNGIVNLEHTSSVVESRRRSLNVQNDHSLKWRVERDLRQRFYAPPVQPQKCEPIPPLSSSALHQTVPSAENDVQKSDQGFMRFLNVLNKGVDINKLMDMGKGNMDGPHSSQNSVQTHSSTQCPKTEEQEKHLQNILESLGLSVGLDEIKCLGDCTLAQLFGKIQNEQNDQQETERKKYSPGQHTRYTYDSSLSSPRKRRHSRSPRRNERSHSPYRKNDSLSPRRNERSHSPYWKNDSLSPRRNERSHSPYRKNDSLSPRRNERSHSPYWKNDSLSPRRNEPSHSPYWKNDSHSPRRNERSHSPYWKNYSHSPRRNERSHSPYWKNDSHSPRRNERSHSPYRKNDSLSPRRNERSHSPYRKNDSLSPHRNERSHSPYWKNDSHFPRRNERSYSPDRRKDSHSPRRNEQSYSPYWKKDSHSPRRNERSRTPYRKKDSQSLHRNEQSHSHYRKSDSQSTHRNKSSCPEVHPNSHPQYPPPMPPYPYPPPPCFNPHFPPPMYPPAYFYSQHITYHNHWSYNQAPAPFNPNHPPPLLPTASLNVPPFPPPNIPLMPPRQQSNLIDTGKVNVPPNESESGSKEFLPQELQGLSNSNRGSCLIPLTPTPVTAKPCTYNTLQQRMLDYEGMIKMTNDPAMKMYWHEKVESVLKAMSLLKTFGISSDMNNFPKPKMIRERGEKQRGKGGKARLVRNVVSLVMQKSKPPDT